MKIFSIELKNYRQYRGINRIELSVNPSEHITIIRGNNGEGKSNLMNAITWCLYGDEMFKSNTNIGRSIVNENEIFDQKNSTVETYVSVEIGNNVPEYRFTRTHTFKLENNKPEIISKSFKCIEKSPETGFVERSNPEWIVEKKFIPKALRGFFFFDGEKMDEYFEDTSKIKSSVQDLAQISILERMIDTAFGVRNQIMTEIRKYNKKPTSKDTISLDEKQNRKQYLESELVNLNYKIEQRKINIEEIDNYLKNNSSSTIKALLDSRKNLENQRNILLDSIESSEKQINDLIQESIPIIFAFRALQRSSELIEENTKKGVLPPTIKDVFLKELLDRDVCICGRSLDDPECRHKIESLLDSIVPSDIANEAIEGKYSIQSMINKIDFRSELSKLRFNVKNWKNELESIREKLNEISAKLTEYNEKEIQNKETERKALLGLNNIDYTTIGTYNSELNEINRFLEEFEDEINKIKSNNEKVINLQSQSEFVLTLRKTLIEIKNSIVDDIRTQLEEKTSKYFFSMIWKQDSFSKIAIIDDGTKYRISVKSAQNQECLGDLSAGERQVLALSFTAALYTVSGYTVPVFIDTPLGRISEKPRENIAENLPNYLNETQLVMLPTDAEYTPAIRERLSNSVGKEYKIIFNEKTKESRIDKYE